MTFLNNNTRSSLYRGFAMVLVAVIITPPLALSIAPEQAHAQNVGGAVVSAAGCTVASIVGGFIGAAGAVVEAVLSVPVSSVSIAAATISSAGSDYANIIKECVLDTLVWSLAQMIIEQMMRDVTSWAASGFDGSPAFVQDTGRWFRDLGENYLYESLADNSPLYEALCTPFRAQIRFSLILGTTKPKPVHDRCSLDEFLNGSSFDIFVEEGNFNAAGFKGFLGLQSRENNPVGSYMATQEEIGKRLRDNVIAPNSNTLAYGKGFLSTKCDNNGDPADGNEALCTPGAFIQDQISAHAEGPLQKIIQADEFAEMINALIAAFVSSILNDDDEGGLLGRSRNNTYWDDVRNDGGGTADWCAQFPDEPLCDGITPEPPIGPDPDPTALTPAEIEANNTWRNDLSVAINALMMNLYGRSQAIQDAYLPRVLQLQSDLFRIDTTTLSATAELADIEERIRLILVELAIFTIPLPGNPVGPSPLPPPPGAPPALPGDPTNPGPAPDPVLPPPPGPPTPP